MEILFVVGRVLFGGYFVLMGINHFKNTAGLTAYATSKKLPAPKESVYLSGLMLLLGGLGVITGAFYAIALWLLVIFLVASAFTMHAYWKAGNPEEAKADKASFQRNLAFAGAGLMLVTIDAVWRYSLMF